MSRRSNGWQNEVFIGSSTATSFQSTEHTAVTQRLTVFL